MVNKCSLCKENEESADHILIHCGKTKEFWTLLFSSFGVVWVFSASVRNLLLKWKVKGLGKKRRAVWRLASICLFCVFRESETKERSKRKRCQILAWGTFFFGLFLSGLNSFWTWTISLFWIFWVIGLLVSFFLSRFFLSFVALFWLSLYTACVRREHPLFWRVLIYFSLCLSKKKKFWNS